MTLSIKFDSATKYFGQKPLMALAASLVVSASLTACGSSDGAAGQAQTSNEYEVEGDHALGDANAAVTIVEYASVTCGHCANWHEAVWPDLRKDYIDTGKVRFIYREFPTSPTRLAEAGFLIANCAAEDKFFANIELQYKKQSTLLGSANNGTAAQEYEALARAAGLNKEEYEACLANEEEYARIQQVVKDGFEAGVTGTPSFFINGEKVNAYTLTDFDEALSEFIDVPERGDTDADAADQAEH